MNRVLVTTALVAMVSFMVIRTVATFTAQNATFMWSGLAVLLMSVFLLKTGWDYTKPSKR